MLGEVHGVMTAWVNVEFVRNLPRRQHLIESNRSSFEAKLIPVSAIKINIQMRQIPRPCNGYGVVCLPENGIGRISKGAAQHASPRRIWLRTSKKIRKLFYQCRAVRAYR